MLGTDNLGNWDPWFSETTKDELARPRRNAENLASMITNDTLEQTQIHNAIQSPHLVMLSDWFHMTSEALREVAISADIDVL